MTAFKEAVQAAIDEHWPQIGPMNDDDIDPIDRAEMQSSHPSAWVLVLGGETLDGTVHSTSRYTPARQSPFVGIGLLYDQLTMWAG